MNKIALRKLICLSILNFGGKEKNMDNAISIIGELDTQNSEYTDHVIFETSSKMDKTTLQNATELKTKIDNKEVKYNAF